MEQQISTIAEIIDIQTCVEVVSVPPELHVPVVSSPDFLLCIGSVILGQSLSLLIEINVCFAVPRNHVPVGPQVPTGQGTLGQNQGQHNSAAHARIRARPPHV